MTKKRKFPADVFRFFNSPQMRGDSKNQMSKHRFIYAYNPKVYQHPNDPNKPYRIPAKAVIRIGRKVYVPLFQ